MQYYRIFPLLGTIQRMFQVLPVMHCVNCWYLNLTAVLDTCWVAVSALQHGPVLNLGTIGVFKFLVALLTLSAQLLTSKRGF